uniref:SUMO specific peptidase 6 n=1 Tax=Rousettus aegyptiacus TaxID=9407 RepID=A0A7J8KGC5_ROUAE|nr:SUMO specific peptidase 6 [Rousettus aegyptiacus]
MAAGKSGGSSGETNFLEALTRAESERDGGFKNNWSFDHGEESEGDTDKDEANLLTVDEDEDSETTKGKKLNRQSEIVATSSGDPWKTCARQNKTESLKPLKGNPIGLNMLSNSKKLRYRHFTTHSYRKDKEFDTETNYLCGQVTHPVK